MAYPAKTERNAQVVRAYEAGVPLADIAAAHSICRTIVRRIAERAGAMRPINPETRRKTLRNRQLVEAYRGGASCSALAEKFGISQSRAYVIVKQSGVALSTEERSRRQAANSRRLMADAAHRAKISEGLRAYWAAGGKAGRKAIFADEPEKRDEYLLLRGYGGAAYARERMGLAA